MTGDERAGKDVPDEDGTRLDAPDWWVYQGTGLLFKTSGWPTFCRHLRRGVTSAVARYLLTRICRKTMASPSAASAPGSS